MKIVEGKAYVVGNPPPHYGGINWVFVKLTTDEGIHGWGEAFGSEVYFASAAKLIDEMCEHFVVGSDPFQIERLCEDALRQRLQPASRHPEDVRPERDRDRLLGHRRQGARPADLQPARRALPREDQDLHLPLPGARRSAAGERGDALLAGAVPALGRARRSSWAIPRSSSIRCARARPTAPRCSRATSSTTPRRWSEAVREVLGSRSEILIGTHGQMTPASRHHAGEAARALRAAVAGGAGAAREHRRDGARRAVDQHPDRDRRAAVDSLRISSCCWRSRRSPPCRWRSDASAGSSKRRRSRRWPRRTT